VALNRAVAISMSSSPETALALVDGLIGCDLARYPLAWATRADILRRLGRHQDSAADYRQAAALTGNGTERRFLTGRADAEIIDGTTIDEWVPRSFAYAQDLPAEAPKTSWKDNDGAR